MGRNGWPHGYQHQELVIATGLLTGLSVERTTGFEPGTLKLDSTMSARRWKKVRFPGLCANSDHESLPGGLASAGTSYALV